jgi:tetratricopeptide (TPR) repeat protein
MFDRAAAVYHEARRSYFALIAEPQELEQQIQLVLSDSADSKLLAKLHSQLGQSYQIRLDQGVSETIDADQTAAIAAFKQAINYWGEHPGIEPLQDMNYLGNLYTQRQEYDRADAIYKEALRRSDEQLEPDYEILIETLKHLAHLYSTMRQFDEAQNYGRRGLAISEAHFGSEHPRTAVSLSAMANIYMSLERYEAALPLFQRALAINKSQLGPGHPDSILSWTKLANAYRYIGQYQQAETLAQRAMTISELELGWQHPHTETCLDTLIKLYLTTQRYSDAEQRYCQTIEQLYRLPQQLPIQAKTINRLSKLIALVEQIGIADQLSRHPITQGLRRSHDPGHS